MPTRIAESLGDDLVVHVTVLAYVKGRQVETEGACTAQQSLDQEQPAEPPSVITQAIRNCLDVSDEMGSRFVTVWAAVVGGAQPLGDL